MISDTITGRISICLTFFIQFLDYLVFLVSFYAWQHVVLSAYYLRHFHLSLAPSVTGCYCTQTNEDTIMQSSLWGKQAHSSFLRPTTVGGDIPFYVKFIVIMTTPTPLKSSEKCRFRSISAYNATAVRASKKCSLIVNRKSTTHFPTSYRWSIYVTANSPSGWLKKRICRFCE